MMSLSTVKLLLSIALCAFLLHPACGQDCPDVKNGTFYSYPSNSKERWKSERSGSTQKEINLNTGDTIFFSVSWANACQYTLKYASGGEKLDKDMLALIKQHPLVSSITASTPDYYVTADYFDATTNYPYAFDTLWHKEQNVTPDRVFLTALSPAEIRKIKIRDTTQYAVLYVYRSSKFVCSKIPFPIYGNNVLMCGLSGNGNAFAFKVTKQGPIRIQGQHNQKKDYLDVDVRFGQKYFVKVDSKWSAARCLPILTEVAKLQGEGEFAEAQYQ